MLDDPTNHWACEGCGERIEPPFEICYQCGAGRFGKPNPYFVREIDAAEQVEQQDQDLPATRKRPLRLTQYTLRGLMVSVFVLCGLLALGGYLGRLYWLIIASALVTNLLGLLTGWVVTHGLGLPNDGSNPADRESPGKS